MSTSTITGYTLLRTPRLNKGTAFSPAERRDLKLEGLLPPAPLSLELQLARLQAELAKLDSDLQRYMLLSDLQVRNETLFYALLMSDPAHFMPIVYTPTVGEVCQKFDHIFRHPRGMYLPISARGRLREILGNWPQQDVRFIVVTDGERILGLGDLGVSGMGIPIGKLSLYTACAGLHPYYCLPITLDVGTDNTKLHEDPLYIGINQRRVRGAEYDAFIAEFVAAVQQAYPKALLQWEDFGNTNAFRLLRQYRDQICSFNDDIQGTASVALAGLLAGLRLTGGRLRDQKLLFLGAGEAGTGIADLLVSALEQEGLSQAEARSRCWFVDSQGLVVRHRPGRLAEHKEPYAQDHPPVATLAAALEVHRPTALIGVSGQAQGFTREIVARMAALNPCPIIFALSNPTSKAECTAEQAYQWSEGRAVFASGSPFPPVTLAGRTYVPGQGNNVYIFPGVGLGALVCEAARITDGMFLTAARTLAAQVGEADLALGRVYPALSKIRDVSVQIATAVADEAHRAGLARRPRPADLEADIRARMFVPEYQDYV